MRTWILIGVLACSLLAGFSSSAHASLLYNTIRTIQQLFEAEDMTHTDWKGVAKDLHDNLNEKSLEKRMDKALGPPEKPPASNEPQPKIRIAQYLLIALFFFIIVIAGILILCMALRR